MSNINEKNDSVNNNTSPCKACKGPKIIKLEYLIDSNTKTVQLFSNNQLTVIPNVLFTTTPFKNYTKTGFYIVPFTIQIVNKSDLDKVIKEISEILDNSDLILKNPSYNIFVKSIGTSGVEIVIKVPISNPLDDTMVVSELLKEFKRKIIFEDL